jgi:hypothetical protein
MKENSLRSNEKIVCHEELLLDSDLETKEVLEYQNTT